MGKEKATVRKLDDGGGLRRKQRHGLLVQPVQVTEKMTWGIEDSLIVDGENPST
jgi:hypothetical protein